MSFPYNSPEARLSKIIDEAQSALEQVRELKKENGQIQKFDAIQFGGGGTLSHPRLENKINSGFDSFGNWSYGAWAERFDVNKKEHIERCYQNALKWIEESKNVVEKWHEENLPGIENNKQVIQKVKLFMESVGIRESWKTYEYRGFKKKDKETQHTAGFMGDLNHFCKTSDNYENAKSQLVVFKEKLEKWYKEKITAINTKEKEKAAKDRELRLLAKAMELAATYGIKSDNNEELIYWVTERAKNEWSEINTDDADYWEIGGDILDGFYIKR